MRLLAPAIALALSALTWIAQPALAQFDEDFGRGLIATMRGTDGSQCVRLDPTISFVWGKTAPDPRISDGKFSARWDGLLLSRTPGEYTIHAHVCGKARVILEGEIVLDVDTAKPQWVSGKPLSMKFDWHPFQVDFAKTQPDAELRLFWSGPDFPLEPIPAEYFYHDIDNTIEQPFERGHELIAGFRCVACHTMQGEVAALPAPSLANLDGNISEPWLRDWLGSHIQENASDSLRRMPHFDLSQDDVEAVTEYLLSESKPRPKEKSLPPKGSAASGQNLVLTLGCTACHKLGDLGTAEVMGGPELTKIAEKRPQGYFQTWLKDPAKLNPAHRMPVYDLNAKERDDISQFLATLSPANAKARTPIRAFDERKAKRGREVVAANRCNACHQMPGEAKFAPGQAVPPLGPGNLWRDACLDQPVAATGQPGYQLSEADRDAIKTYIRQRSRATHQADAKADAAWILTKNNCLSCHPRGVGIGLSEVAKQVSDAHGNLTSLLPAMVPPSLNSVGDKLHDDALLAAIRRSEPTHRPWLKVRMPKFNLSQEEQAALVDYFVAQDRIPANAPDMVKVPHTDGLAATVAGARLVTTDGFGCTSCHQVGQMVPPKAPLNAKGPDLSMLGKRIREPWFYRWVHDPARIVPRMEMPSVKLPVQGVLDNNIDTQLAAVWHVLNTPDFTPPKPDPVRIVRQNGLRRAASRPVVLTDVMKFGLKQTLIKPLLVGLPNRNNVLYDLESAALTQWWVGDVARQRSEGKTWHWEPGGRGLLKETSTGPEIMLKDSNGKLLKPVRDGQFFTRFQEIDYEGDRLAWTHELKFGETDPVTIELQQMLSPEWTDQDQPVNSFRRVLTFANIPAGVQLGLQLPRQTVTGPLQLDASIMETFRFAAGDVRIDVDKSPGVSVDQQGVVWLSGDTAATLSLTFHLDLPGEILQPPAQQVPVRQSEAVPLDIIPGWSATRLPITTEMMPIAMDWQPSGALIAASLKGRLWKLTDTDGDGLEDTYQQFGDEYAAPYGLKAHAKYVDVANKYALLRLWDEDGDGQIERVTTLADGWGHTDDYHDWVVGLPQDEEGNYYLAVPCQQDDRSMEAAKLRGTVLKLIPDSSNPANQTFRIEELTAGHRFPMGIARNKAGELFVTDNQGNWNPFNELNHVVPGLRYGFINKVDRAPGFAPVETPPSIAIPHPWTRSVNGICFLETPAQERDRLGYDLYGPWEGDLIGCEYDTRRLVRMSIEKVGDVIQGAVYPLTLDPPKDAEKGLLGPVSCAVAPDGDVYIGNIRDAGWGGGNNVGAFTRMRPNSVHLPVGIDEVTLTPNGFQIRFTAQIDGALGGLASNYTVASYTRESTPAYGGDDKQRRLETVSSVQLSPDRLVATITLESPMREGFVYEIFLDDEVAGQGQTLWPKEAHYTVRKTLAP
ncbi:c-type cytochrome [Blastopirellula marina]|uniref:Cytochrome c n=1 Tax=Blastopirellula marina TaxID=124 RepID=A0A2S8FP04_9BACT|nr:c-type cytochrome [Blastopirellula marina]PQO33720.1 hypothetical protein C5Y98_15925 [Blastopirellula marina]PTL43507.1 hypothetical protein C5Y97_15935 [Blastopirellula marina]